VAGTIEDPGFLLGVGTLTVDEATGNDWEPDGLQAVIPIATIKQRLQMIKRQFACIGFGFLLRCSTCTKSITAGYYGYIFVKRVKFGQPADRHRHPSNPTNWPL
jgi:hypothetical protein